MPAAAAHQVDQEPPIPSERARPKPPRHDDSARREGPEGPDRRDDFDELDWSDVTDAEGEAYTSFAYEDDWPGPFGAASVGAP